MAKPNTYPGRWNDLLAATMVALTGLGAAACSGVPMPPERDKSREAPVPTCDDIGVNIGKLEKGVARVTFTVVMSNESKPGIWDVGQYQYLLDDSRNFKQSGATIAYTFEPGQHTVYAGAVMHVKPGIDAPIANNTAINCQPERFTVPSVNSYAGS